MEWLIKAIMDVERVYLVDQTKRGLHQTQGVQIRWVDGIISIGGEVIAASLPHHDFSIELWLSDGSMLSFDRFDVDILGERGAVFFNATSVAGMSRVTLSPDGNCPVIKHITVSL